MKVFLKKKGTVVLFAVAGAVGGFLYWKFIGCISGTCPIQSVWYWSTLWGTLFGFLVGDVLNDYIVKRREKQNK